jgi:hypothetical protein
MYPDRTRLLPLENSDWNAWLIDELADFAVSLLPRELFRIYTADAYETFRTAPAAAHVPGLVERVDELLRKAPCWPSASRRQGAPPLVASELLFADDRTTRPFVQQELSLDKQLHPELAKRESTREMAAKNGAVRFSVNSLIRLRSLTGSYVPKTPISAGEYSGRFVAFAPHMRQLHVQQRWAKALDGLSEKLSKEHRLDLEQAPATLSAAGTLVPARDLVIVPQELLRIASPETTLHSSLTGSKMIASLCKTLGTSGWVIHMADRVRGGTASDVERESFAAYLRKSPQLSDRAWAAVRRSPVLRDDRGEWSAPSTWVHPSTPGAKRYFSGAVRFPAALTPAMLVGRLRLRKKLSGSDVVALAQRVAAGAVDPGTMIEALHFASQRRSLLGAATLKELSTKQFLLFGDRLLAPSETYLDDERLRELLGTDVCFVTQVPGPLARLLGCRAEPSLADVLKHIESLRQSGVGPRHPGALHAQMIECARREHVDPAELATKPVLWNQERGWEAPSDCLVGDDWRDLFRGAVTVLSDSRSIRWASIGVAQRPAVRHWIRYFERLSGAHATRGVSSRERTLLLQAYRIAEGFPFNLPADCLSLLTLNGLLRPLGERLTGAFVINDFPVLALALSEARVSINFAEPSARTFFESIGVKRLSHVAKSPRIDLGNVVHPREALHLQTYLGRVANPDFGKALAAVVVALDPSGALGEEKVRSAISRFGHVEVVTDIREVWNVFGTEITSPAQSYCGPEAVYLANPSNLRQCLRRLAQALADMVVPHGQPISAYIESLLLCRSRREMEEELSGWQIPWPTDWESADAEAPGEQGDNDETIVDLVEDAVRRIFLGSAPGPQSPAPGSISPIPSPCTSNPREFPDPSTVTLSEVRLGQASQRVAGVAGGRPGSLPPRGTPRTPEEVALDTTLGHNAERWVYDLEQERVATLGLSPDEVVWVSADAPLSDHDLCSPGVDGFPVFVEVKATVSRDGAFVWTASEFRRAMRARDHYLLYRVFDAASLNPKFARVWDPISGLEAQTIQLEVERLVIDIGPMVTDELDD